jgi:nucleotide-binding universal stress UspA family protein
MSRILFPTDLSDISANVLPSARNLAELLGGELTVLHAYKERSRLRSLLQPQKKKREAWHKLADFCSVEDRKIPSNFSLMLRQGDAVDTIIEASKNGQFRYVIMGRKHAYENFRKLTGDKTAQVLSSAFCPTVVLPENRPIGTIRNILILGANYRHTDSIVQQELLLLSMTTGASLHYLDVHHNPTEWEHHKELLHGQSFLVQKIIPKDYTLESTMEYIEDQQIDLLVMLGKRRSLFESLFEYGVEHGKLQLVNLPLLVFHPHYLDWKHNQLKLSKQVREAKAAV